MVIAVLLDDLLQPEVDCPSDNLQRANDLSPYYKF
jgi:hypothetical protein